MKKFFKTVLKYYLKFITKLVLLIHRPTVIAIAGSTNKAFLKKEVKTVLEDLKKTVRANPKNFNTEIGLPLAILYLPSGYNEYKNWLPAMLKAPLIIFQKNFPKYLVLSLGTSDSGDMKYLLSIVRPQISIITDITQRYLEGYNDMDNLVDEYRILSGKTRNLLILNNDNPRVRSLKNSVSGKVRVKTLGENTESDYIIKDIQREKDGENFLLQSRQGEKKHKLKRFGKHHIYARGFGLIIKDYLEKHG